MPTTADAEVTPDTTAPRRVTIRERMGSTLGDKAVAALAAVIVILLVAGTAAALGPGRGIREDIADQRQNTDEMLATIQRQLEVMESQLAHIEATRSSSDFTAGIAEQQLAIVQRQLELLEQQDAKTEEALRLQRRLVELAEQTLREVREINRKTPPAGAALTPARP